jgi:hypothetical protein
LTLLFASFLALAAAAAPASASAESCRPADVRAALGSFAHAYSRGEYATLDSLFAPEPDFQWYSTDAPGTRLRGSSKRRATLVPYFEARHRLHDRFALRTFQFNGNSPRYGNFQMEMRRRTDGFRGGKWFGVFGKGAAICDGDDVRFIVLTFGTMPAGSHGPAFGG